MTPYCLCIRPAHTPSPCTLNPPKGSCTHCDGNVPTVCDFSRAERLHNYGAEKMKVHSHHSAFTVINTNIQPLFLLVWSPQQAKHFILESSAKSYLRSYFNTIPMTLVQMEGEVTGGRGHWSVGVCKKCRQVNSDLNTKEYQRNQVPGMPTMSHTFLWNTSYRWYKDARRKLCLAVKRNSDVDGAIDAGPGKCEGIPGQGTSVRTTHKKQQTLPLIS